MNETLNFWGKSKNWWLFLIIGILVFCGGCWLATAPGVGYEIIAVLFGWFLLFAGISQIIMTTSLKKHLHGWGWFLAGGIIDIFVAIILIMNLGLTEASLPYIYGFLFMFKGVASITSSFMMMGDYKYWWLYLINGLILMVLSWIFIMLPVTAAFTIVFITAFMMIYWGISLVGFSFDLKPKKSEN
ncbi:MAG: HdeD family acid-resistance protein [Bacteroidales bacterium]